MANKLKRSQSVQVYSQRPYVYQEAVATIDNWQRVMEAWPPDENKDKTENRDKVRRNLIRRLWIYISRKLRGKRKVRVNDLTLKDIEEGLVRLESEEEGSDVSKYYTVSSNMDAEKAAQKNEEIEALQQRVIEMEEERRLEKEEKEALQQRVKELEEERRVENEEKEALQQRVQELEEERRVNYTTNKGGLVINDSTCVIHIGEEYKSSKKMEE